MKRRIIGSALAVVLLATVPGLIIARTASASGTVTYTGPQWNKILAQAKGETVNALELQIVDQNLTFLPKASGKSGKFEGPGPPNAFNVFSVAGEITVNAIGMHPNHLGNAYIDLKAGKKYKSFRAIVSQNDGLPTVGAPITFSVYGDEKLLWRAKGVTSQKDTQPSPEIDISNVDLLTLEVKGTSFNGAHMIWFEPFLEK